ncbi:MAG: ATP-binding protein [Euryarchaeota archaeon]|nr:ATP-binding protein [Euryarchaeota archaeon]
MLTTREIETRIEEWESQTTEFKKEFTTDPIRQTITALSNDYAETGGGVIIIGVDPSTRVILGLTGDPEETLRRVTGICRDGSIVPTLAPQIYQLDVNGKTVGIIEVKQSERRPHRANNICYIRIGPTTRKATPDEEFELVRRSGRFPFDMMPVREAAVEDLDMLKFEQEFLAKRVSSGILSVNHRSPIEWAENLKFLVREGDRLIPTVAAILLFGKNPQSLLPHGSIDFIRFEGDDPSYPIADRKELTGTIDEQIKSATEIVGHFMIQSYQFSQKSPVRTDIVEYPLRAVREAVTNAVMHRDYEISRTNVSIKMFDDRLEIMSPGGLYGIVTRDNFGTGINDYRNPTLAVNLNLLGLIEKAGTGIFLIRRQMEENGSFNPEFDIGDRHLIVKLPAHPHYSGVRLYQKGLVSLEEGKRDEALRLFKRSTDIVPHLAEVWAALGRMEGLYGDIEAAQKDFQRAIENNPQFDKAYLEWGKMEDQAGNTHRSQEIFRQGTKAILDSATLWYAWALLEQKLQNQERAVGLFRKAVSIQPDDPKLWRALGNATFRLDDLDEANDSLQKALQYTINDNDKGIIFFELMKVLIEQNTSIEKVKECFDSAYSLDFKSQELFHRYYHYLTDKGAHAEALEVLELARTEGINITPSLPELYIGGLPQGSPKNKLKKEVKEIFRKEGIEVTKIYIHPSRGFGFVKVVSDADARKAIKSLDKARLLGRSIVVDMKR